MDELDLWLRKGLYFLIGSVSVTLDRTAKFVQDVGDQTQSLIDEMIQEGERQYYQWVDQQEIPPEPPSEDLRQKMFTLVRGDWTLAERLLAQERKMNPGQTETWYFEKVIYDLERDHQG